MPGNTLRLLFCLRHHSGGPLAVSGGGLAPGRKRHAPLVLDISDYRPDRRDTGFRRNRRRCSRYREDPVLRVSCSVVGGSLVGSTLGLKIHASSQHVRAPDLLVIGCRQRPLPSGISGDLVASNRGSKQINPGVEAQLWGPSASAHISGLGKKTGQCCK
jgi:hypothetical protein